MPFYATKFLSFLIRLGWWDMIHGLKGVVIPLQSLSCMDTFVLTLRYINLSSHWSTYSRIYKPEQLIVRPVRHVIITSSCYLAMHQRTRRVCGTTCTSPYQITIPLSLSFRCGWLEMSKFFIYINKNSSLKLRLSKVFMNV